MTKAWASRASIDRGRRDRWLGPTSLQTARAVLPRTAFKSVGSYGLNEPSMSFTQAEESHLGEIAIGPASGTGKAFWVGPMTFQENPTQAATNHSVIFSKYVPKAVAKIGEPTEKHAIQAGGDTDETIFGMRMLS